MKPLALALAAGVLLVGCGKDSTPRADDDIVPALSPDDFDQTIAKGTVLVDFWTDW